MEALVVAACGRSNAARDAAVAFAVRRGAAAVVYDRLITAPDGSQWFYFTDHKGTFFCNYATAKIVEDDDGTSLARQLVAADAFSEARPLRPEPPAAQEGQSQVSAGCCAGV